MKNIVLALMIVNDLIAQQPKPEQSKFEVISIHPVPQDAPLLELPIGATTILPGGKYVDQRAALESMIAFAYNVRNPSHQLLGLPKWAKSQSFSVAAQAGENFPAMSEKDNREQVRLMVRAMLEDRFGLRAHAETRQERVFHLKVAKGGIKSLKKVDPPVPPAKEGFVGMAMNDDGGRIIGKTSTMAGLASSLAVFLKYPVLNETGLPDYYDFDLAWHAPEKTNLEASPGLGSEGLGLLLSVLREECGLSITAGKGPVEYLVVDHVQLPAEN